MADEKYARKNIVPDVLDNLIDKDFSQFIKKVIPRKKSMLTVDLERFKEDLK